jgi:(E)-4-hydroxy-3-methylbut-2-enyl-diphosphate synthase
MKFESHELYNFTNFINFLLTMLPTRFPTRVVNIGSVPLGGNNPVRVQSMTNTDTLDTRATVDQAIRMIDAGCEYVRIAVPGTREAKNLRNIKNELHKRGYQTPLIADVHFNPNIAEVAATIVEKVRINPGNYVSRRSEVGGRRSEVGGRRSEIGEEKEELDRIYKRIGPLLKICKEHGTALRIGTNHGSLSARIMKKYGDTPKGMVESALEFVRICEAWDFHDIVLGMKASNVKVMIAANRLLVDKMKADGMNYPIHLGVTEAGSGEDGRIRSAVGIGSLLADGIGDTIRVSITEDPENEIPVAYGILQATGVRITKTEFISCPSCARTLFNIQEVLEKVKARTGNLKGLKIAVMGCIVNGPGEMADADYGYVGSGKGKVMLYKRQELVKKNVAEAVALEELIRLIKEGGDWEESS